MSHAVRRTCLAAAALAVLAVFAIACVETTSAPAGDPQSATNAEPTSSAAPEASFRVPVFAPSNPGDWNKPNPNGKAVGEACAKPDDCQSGVCEGEGCSSGPTCVDANRSCTRDLATFCGCDGQSFSASGSCPGRPFAKRGACE
jgi:hypothetical protein